MEIRVVMPQLPEAGGGEVVRWLKAPGDRVACGEPLFEVVVGSAGAEVASPTAGTLCEIVSQVGATVAPGDPVALLAEVVEVTGVLVPAAGGHDRGPSGDQPADEAASAEYEHAMADLVRALAGQMEAAGGQAPNGNADQRLVGAWHRSEFYTSGGFSMRVHRFRVLGADGRFVDGGDSFADLALLDSSGNWAGLDSLETGAPQDRGIWRVDGDVLTLARDDGSTAQFSFEAAPDGLLLVSASGDRTLWTRG